MSMERSVTVTCPKCGAEGDFVIWRSLNTQLDPDMKAKVLSGEIFRFRCPKCGEESSVVYPMLYHQMEDQIMIHLVTSDEDVEDAAKAFDDIANGTMMPGIDMSEADYTFRMVGTQNQLREKIYIFDSDMDDRAVEMYKLCLKSNMLVNQPEIKVAEMFLEMNEGEPENFAVRLEDGTWGTMPFRKEMYERIKQDMLDSSDDGKRTYFVDQQWAIEYMDARVPR